MNPWLLGFVAGAFLFGSSEISRFERGATRDILSQLEGPNKTVKIRTRFPGVVSPALGEVGEVRIEASHFETEGLPLFTEPNRSTAGTIKALEIVLRDFTLKGLRIELLEARIPDCRFDFQLALHKRQIRLSRSGTGTGRVRILATDLEKFILRKYQEIKSCEVRFENGKVRVTGFGEFLIFKTQFDVLASIGTDGSTLFLKDAAISFDGKPADEGSKGALLQTMNPVVDLNADLDLYGAITVKELAIENGALEARGPTKIPVRPE